MLHILHRAWSESEDAMLRQDKEVKAAFDAAEAREKERRYPRTLLSETTMLEYELKEIAVAVQALRQAFVLSLYHSWERSLIEWMGNKDTTADKKYEWLKSNRLKCDEKVLEDLRELLRLIKHDKGENIAKRRADLFPSGVIDVDAMHIETKHMDEFFSSVSASGYPRYGGYVDAKPAQ